MGVWRTRGRGSRAVWGVALVAALALAACGPAPPVATATPPIASASAPSQGSTLANEGGMVTVFATWAGPAAGPVFKIALDTHSVNLDGYDLAKQAVLRVDGREVAATAWDAPKGGHHRSGNLVFPTSGADGAPTIGAGARAVEVVVRDVAGVPERTFRWPL
jgi:hypothetical protein